MPKSVKPVRKSPATPPAAAAPPAPVDRIPAAGLAAFTALCVATPFVPSEGVAEQGVHVVLVALWFGILLGWILLGIARGGLEIRWHGTLLAVAGFVLWIAVAGLLRMPDGHPRFTLNVMWHWVSVAVMFFLATQFLRHPAEARALTVVMLALACVLSSFGLFQYAYSLPKTRAAFAANPEQALLAAGVSAPPGSAERKHYVDRLNSTEPFATFSLTNSLAGFIAPWLVMGVCLLLLVWNDRKQKTRVRVALLLAMLVMGYCLLLTKSRTGVLASLVGIGLAIVYARAGNRKPGWKIPLAGAAALGVLVLAALVASSLDTRLMSEAPKSVLVRLQYWRSTAAMIADAPLLGCGPGNFQDFYTQYKLPEASETVKDPHNFLLEVWATSGTPALLLLGLIFVAWAYDLRRAPTGPAPKVDVAGNPQAVGWGAAAGALLGPCVAFLSAYAFDEADLLFLFLVAVPLACWGAWSLRGWVAQGTLPTSAAVVAIVTLLINLLAAGSLAYPGVGLSLWVVLAVGLANYRPATRLFPIAPAETLVVWAATSLVAITFIYSGYSPTLKGRGDMDEAGTHLASYQMFHDTNQPTLALRDLEKAVASLEQARFADRYNADAWLQLATAQNAYWIATEKPEFASRFEEAAQKAVELRPHAAQTYAQLSDLYLAAYRSFGQERFLAEARRLAEKAVELYPNSNHLHAQLAWICFLANDRASAAAEAAEALRLDEILPHEELKLKYGGAQDTAPRATFAAQQEPPPREANLAQLMQRLLNSPVTP